MHALGVGFFQFPWMSGMWLLFAFEFVEGNTITRRHFRRLLRLSRAALNEGRMTAELEAAMRDRLGAFAHYLDPPVFFLIVSLGTFRPTAWDHFIIGTLLAVTIAAALTFSRLPVGGALRPR